MCTAALRYFGITKISFAESNDRFGGCGSVFSAHAGSKSGLAKSIPELNEYPLERKHVHFKQKAVFLLRKFYLYQNECAPNPKNKSRRKLKESDDGLLS